MVHDRVFSSSCWQVDVDQNGSIHFTISKCFDYNEFTGQCTVLETLHMLLMLQSNHHTNKKHTLHKYIHISYIIYACMRACRHAYIHTYIITSIQYPYTHTCIHAYVPFLHAQYTHWSPLSLYSPTVCIEGGCFFGIWFHSPAIRFRPILTHT